VLTLGVYATHTISSDGKILNAAGIEGRWDM